MYIRYGRDSLNSFNRFMVDVLSKQTTVKNLIKSSYVQIQYYLYIQFVLNLFITVFMMVLFEIFNIIAT